MMIEKKFLLLNLLLGRDRTETIVAGAYCNLRLIVLTIYDRASYDSISHIHLF